MTYVLGVDAGNTKTVALVATKDGEIIGYGRSGCGDIYGAGSADIAVSNVVRAVQDALQCAGIRADELDVGAFSMAGADWPEDVLFLHDVMKRHGLGRDIVVVNDAIGGLRAGSSTGIGVSVIQGTGVAIGAKSPDGRVWSGGFWVQDVGTFEMAKRAMKATYMAHLGMARPTRLCERVMELFQQPSIEHVLYLLTHRGRTIARLPAPELARIVLDEAENGDEAARDIVFSEGKRCAAYAVCAARQVGIESHVFPLVLGGGVFRHPSRLLPHTIIERVQEKCAGATPVFCDLEPVVGALFLAYDRANIEIDEKLQARIRESMPGQAFFATL
jgi:N-acetylglucosamine kinase-like BadF-type ATPase